MPYIDFGITAKDRTGIGDKRSDVEWRLSGGIRGRQVRAKAIGLGQGLHSDDSARNQIDVELTCYFLIFGDIDVRSLRKSVVSRIVREPGYEMKFWKDSEVRALCCGVSDVGNCSCKVGFWFERLYKSVIE